MSFHDYFNLFLMQAVSEKAESSRHFKIFYTY
jgi:hypothetical protein